LFSAAAPPYAAIAYGALPFRATQARLAAFAALRDIALPLTPPRRQKLPPYELKILI